MPEALCSYDRLDKVARLFVRNIKSPVDASTEACDDWSASVSGTEEPISILSTLQAGELSVRISYAREIGKQSDLYVFYSPGLPFTV